MDLKIVVEKHVRTYNLFITRTVRRMSMPILRSSLCSMSYQPRAEAVQVCHRLEMKP